MKEYMVGLAAAAAGAVLGLTLHAWGGVGDEKGGGGGMRLSRDPNHIVKMVVRFVSEQKATDCGQTVQTFTVASPDSGKTAILSTVPNGSKPGKKGSPKEPQ
jgi:hypothetical protein